MKATLMSSVHNCVCSPCEVWVSQIEWLSWHLICTMPLCFSTLPFHSINYFLRCTNWVSLLSCKWITESVFIRSRASAPWTPPVKQTCLIHTPSLSYFQCLCGTKLHFPWCFCPPQESQSQWYDISKSPWAHVIEVHQRVNKLMKYRSRSPSLIAWRVWMRPIMPRFAPWSGSLAQR